MAEHAEGPDTVNALVEMIEFVHWPSIHREDNESRLALLYYCFIGQQERKIEGFQENFGRRENPFNSP